MQKRIGIVAPSSKVPQVEFALGVEQLRASGFHVQVHPQCRKSHSFFAGTDQERAEAFFEYAMDRTLPVLWCARGGYGSMRILPWLDRLVEEKGIPPKKLLAGYSDATALLDYVQSRWGWSVLHAPMPGIRAFCTQTAVEWRTLTAFLQGSSAVFEEMPWGRTKLRFLGKVPEVDIRGPVAGGNLTVWNTLLGTPYAPKTDGKILFFEDIGEGLYRLDRMLQQLRLAGGFRGVKAVVLGNFDGCNDVVPNVLAKKPATTQARNRMLTKPKPTDFGPLRKKMNPDRAIPQIFAEALEGTGIPLAFGLPAGHGPGHASLPLAGDYRLGTNGRFELIGWDWTENSGFSA